jgi:hypothetical protein
MVLPVPGGPYNKTPQGGVNTNLLVELMVCERQFHCFRNLLLLNVIASNILFPFHIEQFKNYG